MCPHGPIPTPENVRYLLDRALEKIGSLHRFAMRLELTKEEVQRYLDGEPVPARIFLACVDILFEPREEGELALRPERERRE